MEADTCEQLAQSCYLAVQRLGVDPAISCYR